MSSNIINVVEQTTTNTVTIEQLKIRDVFQR
jgi:hypothetical protein